MTEYIIYKELARLDSLDDYFRQTVPDLYDSFAYGSGILRFNAPFALSAEQEAIVRNAVENFIPPEYYLSLSSTFTDSSSVKPHNDTQLTTIKTFIHPGSFLNDGIFDSFKTIVKYTHCNPLDLLLNTNCSLTLQIYCETRNYLLKEVVLDVSDILQEWKTDLNASEFVKYRTLQIKDLRSQVTNYDTICSLKAKISNPNVYFSLHSLQSLFYNLSTN